MMMASEALVSGRVGGRAVTISEADIQALNLPNDERPQTMSASVCAVFVLEK
jgi:hypothetical protein